MKNAKNYVCDTCDFKCFKKSNYDAHLATRKHEILTNPNKKNAVKCVTEFRCECGKTYKHRSTLSSHRKKCNGMAMVTSTSELDCVKTMFMEAMTKMAEVVQIQSEDRKNTEELMSKMIDKIGNTNITNNTNNFNINMFLNNECKDAINFSDFIDRIEISHDDLENNARLGFVEGISKIFVDNLSQLSLYQRPIHCTDTKRETLYIKDDDTWNKEKETVKKMIDKSIQEISRKSVRSLMDWKSTNDDYNDINSEFSNKCIHIQKHSMAGDDRDKLYPKVMKKLAHSATLTREDIVK